jgi:hypothetical protein
MRDNFLVNNAASYNRQDFVKKFYYGKYGLDPVRICIQNRNCKKSLRFHNTA